MTKNKPDLGQSTAGHETRYVGLSIPEREDWEERSAILMDNGLSRGEADEKAYRMILDFRKNRKYPIGQP